MEEKLTDLMKDNKQLGRTVDELNEVRFLENYLCPVKYRTIYKRDGWKNLQSFNWVDVIHVKTKIYIVLTVS